MDAEGKFDELSAKIIADNTPKKEKYFNDDQPVDKDCDCLLCTTYSRAYLRHLFKIEDLTAVRLATIHNLRFYSRLMESLRGRTS